MSIKLIFLRRRYFNLVTSWDRWDIPGAQDSILMTYSTLPPPLMSHFLKMLFSLQGWSTTSWKNVGGAETGTKSKHIYSNVRRRRFSFKGYCAKELLCYRTIFYRTPEIAFALGLRTSFRFEGKQIISIIEKAVNVYIWSKITILKICSLFLLDKKVCG